MPPDPVSAVAVARVYDVCVDEPRVLEDGANLVLHLAPAPVVARIAMRMAELRPEGLVRPRAERAGAGAAPPARDEGVKARRKFSHRATSSVGGNTGAAYRPLHRLSPRIRPAAPRRRACVPEMRREDLGFDPDPGRAARARGGVESKRRAALGSTWAWDRAPSKLSRTGSGAPGAGRSTRPRSTPSRAAPSAAARAGCARRFQTAIRRSVLRLGRSGPQAREM